MKTLKKTWCFQISKIVSQKNHFGISIYILSWRHLFEIYFRLLRRNNKLKINNFLMNIWRDNWRFSIWRRKRTQLMVEIEYSCDGHNLSPGWDIGLTNLPKSGAPWSSRSLSLRQLCTYFSWAWLARNNLGSASAKTMLAYDMIADLKSLSYSPAAERGGGGSPVMYA